MLLQSCSFAKPRKAKDTALADTPSIAPEERQRTSAGKTTRFLVGGRTMLLRRPIPHLQITSSQALLIPADTVPEQIRTETRAPVRQTPCDQYAVARDLSSCEAAGF